MNGFKKHLTFSHFFTIVLFLLLIFASVRSINLTNSDIGRHLINGREILNGNTSVLYNNFYSYTSREYPTINHHWLYGVISWIIFSIGGFSFIGLFNAVAIAGALLILTKITHNKTYNAINYIACLFIIVSLPIIKMRLEIRPEILSYFFMTLNIYLLEKATKEHKKRLLLPLLILLNLVWVNTHIFFILGIFTTLVYLTVNYIKEKELSVIITNPRYVITYLACTLLNPHTIKGAIEPLTIFKEYGYLLAENQSIFFMYNRNPKFEYIHFFFLAFLTIQLILFTYYKDKKWIKDNVNKIIIGAVFFLMGIKAIRLMPLFIVIFIPIAASMTNILLDIKAKKALAYITCALLTASVIIQNSYFSFFDNRTRMGLLEVGQDSAMFFLDKEIKGPVFNNYDIGGYLIYNLFPMESVFVDNRPEAYSVEFFKDKYIPMQESNEIWELMEEEYKFNVIYFYRHDLTPWGQNFLIERFKDPDWVPVFVDEYTIIFLKDNEQNSKVIEEYRLPDSYFNIKTT